MYTCILPLLAASAGLAAAAEASSAPFAALKRSVLDALGLSRRADCPSVWTTIASQLSTDFVTDGQCNDDARAAIRAAFHDCFNGACDGSLILADECSNSENEGLAGLCTKLGDMANANKVGVADLIQFAGAAAVKLCPLGPTVPTFVGRTDSSTAGAAGVLPQANASADSVYDAFTAKGFSARELAALLGAHSTAKQFTTDPSKAGASLDTTPGTWDVLYYGETLSKTAPFTIPADAALAQHAEVGPAFKGFVANQGGWNAAFAPAMSKLSLLGVDGGSSGLTDCTAALPGGTSKRDIKAAPINGRVRY